LTIIPANVKAESAGTTTLYFHDMMIEDEDLLYLLDFYNLEKLEDLLDDIEESDLDEDAFFNLLEELSLASGLSRTMDQNTPIKTNDSEYPPTLKTIIDMCIKGDWDILYDVLISYFAPFQGVYVYNGDENLEINGEIKFNLYFSSPLWYIWNKDTVNVTFSILTTTEDADLGEILESKFTKTESVEVKRELLTPLKNPIEYEIPITVDTSLEPGDIILTEIGIDAGEKLFLDYLNLNISDLNQSLEELGKILNKTGIKFLSNISETLLNISDILGEDFSDLNLSEILQKMSSSFIYDSADHKSSLTLPCRISGEEENVKNYYLHDGNQMSEELPTKDKPSQVDLKDSAKWDGPILERSKILKEATASLYIDHIDLVRLINIFRGKIKVTATLFSGDTQTASSAKELDRTTILALLQKPSEPMTFVFSDLSPYEIDYGNGLSLDVSASETKFGLLSLNRNAKLLYDSTDYPSSLTVKFDETDHIKINTVADPLDNKVVPGGSVKYTLNITSDFDDDIDIQTLGFSQNEREKWEITIDPESIHISKGSYGIVDIVVKSTDVNRNAYGENIDVTFVATGKTGKDVFDAFAEVSEDAIEYNIEVTADPQDLKIKHGKSGAYIFTIKNMNTGLWPDSYTIEASSEHDWDLNISYDVEDLNDLASGDKVDVKVTVSVPEDTDVSSDILKFTVTSEEGKKEVTVNVTTTVAGPNILEILYGFFESAAESLGLDSIFGSYAPHVLAVIIFVVIFLIIIILALLLTRKYVNVVCLERVKEITPEEEAKFEITIQNPCKHKFSYEIRAGETSSSQSWDVSLDTNNVVLEPKQSRTVILTVKPTSLVKSDDLAEVKVWVKVLEKQKVVEISTATVIKDAKPELYITGVFHWPRVFKKGDKVVTSFKLENKGNVSANNISVVLYVNGEEKNKVENITIPSGGYADIEMPWIAVKGKNEVNIVVK